MVQRVLAPAVAGVLAVLILAGTAPANPQTVDNGRGASAVTDRDGVTHMVYNVPNGTDPDQIGYCRIARGADTCTDKKLLSFSTATLDCQPRAGERDPGNDDHWRWDDPEVMITPFGEVFIQDYAWCAGDYRTIVFASTDQGDTFDTGHVLARRSWEPYDFDGDPATLGESVLDPADRTVVSAISLNYPTGNAADNGGVFIQSAPLGGYTSTMTRMTSPTDIDAGNGAAGHPTIVQRGNRSFAAAWSGYYDHDVVVRTYAHPERPPADVNDASLWGAPIRIGSDDPNVNYDMPRLVSGPLGTFLTYRSYSYHSDTASYNPYTWVIRRVNDDNTLGPEQPIPSPARFDGLSGSYIGRAGAGPASIVEDQANGRLHFARWVPGFQVWPNHVQYLVSDDGGATWTADRYLPADQWRSDRTFDFGADGDLAYQAHDPVLAAATSVNGFAGIAGYSRGYYGNYNGRVYYPFGVLALPDSGAPPTPGGGGGGVTPTPPGDGGGGGGGAPNGGGGGAAPPANPEDRRCRILQFAALDVLADACLTQEKGVYIARGGVQVNGLKLAGAEVRFDPKALTVTSTGPVEMSVGPAKLFRGTVDWKLPKTSVFDLGKLDVSSLGTKLFGFGIKGDVDVQFVRGAVEIKTHLGMPSLLGGITGDVIARADNLAGLHVRELRVAIASAKLGPLELADIDFNYNPDEDAWGGTVKLSLPPDPPGAAIRGHIQFANGEITELGGELTLPSPGIALDPFSVAWLTKIRASMQRPPLRLSGGITIGAGPLLDKTTGDRPIVVDGDLTVTLPDSGPSTIEGNGVGSVMGIPLGTAYVKFVTTGQISAGGKVAYNFGPFSVDGHIDGWFYKNAFNFRGGADVCADPVCIGGDVVFSSVGFAACADVGFTDIGAGITWGSDLALALINPLYIVRHVSVMPVGCDVGDYEAHASAAQAGGERTVTFKDGLPSGFVGVIGQGAPPHVALVGPDGTRVEPQPNAPFRSPGAFAFQSAKGNLTWFAVRRPKAGVWRIVPEADSVPIASVSQANGLPKPQVTASVRRTSGRSRVLSYKIAPIPGQTVTFTEEGHGGVGAPLGKATSRSAGTVRFVPVAGPGGTRRIVATVNQKGLPRATLTVARYVAPAPPKPKRPKVTLKRSGTKLVVSWGADAAARRFTARVALSDGRVLLLVSRRPRVTVAGVAKATTGRVTVYGEDASRVKGPTGTAVLRKVLAKRHGRA